MKSLRRPSRGAARRVGQSPRKISRLQNRAASTPNSAISPDLRNPDGWEFPCGGLAGDAVGASSEHS
jgi:hypothetical protein